MSLGMTTEAAVKEGSSDVRGGADSLSNTARNGQTPFPGVPCDVRTRVETSSTGEGTGTGTRRRTSSSSTSSISSRGRAPTPARSQGGKPGQAEDENGRLERLLCEETKRVRTKLPSFHPQLFIIHRSASTKGRRIWLTGWSETTVTSSGQGQGPSQE